LVLGVMHKPEHVLAGASAPRAATTRVRADYKLQGSGAVPAKLARRLSARRCGDTPRGLPPAGLPPAGGLRPRVGLLPRGEAPRASAASASGSGTCSNRPGLPIFVHEGAGRH